MEASEYPRVTSAQMKTLDARTIDEYDIPAIVLMENAGRGAGQIIDRFAMNEGLSGGPIAVVCGRGNNGGDGFVLARHLANRGHRVEIFFDGDPNKPGPLSEETETNFNIAQEQGIPISSCDGIKPRLGEASLIVDALLGLGLKGEVRPETRRLIEAINAAAAPVIAVDVPSGLDCDTGHPLGAAVVAAETATFGLPKVGFFENEGPRHVGTLHVIDIGIPAELTRENI